MKKIIISVILMLALCMSLMSCSNKNKGAGDNGGNSGDGAPQSENKCGKEMVYKLNETEDAYTLVRVGECTCEEIIVPATYEGLPVTVIGDSAFMNCQTVKSITVSEGVKDIWHRAFSNCRSLESVELPGSIENMGFYVFSNCVSLDSVTIPAGVAYVGGDIFQRCVDITVNCEAESQPAEWNKNWHSGLDINWGYKG